MAWPVCYWSNRAYTVHGIEVDRLTTVSAKAVTGNSVSEDRRLGRIKRKKKSKTIGILGGMGPAATADCFSKIIESTPARCDQEHLYIKVENNPSVPDRTDAILKNGKSPVPSLLSGCQKLEKMKADFIIIPCNTAHYFMDQLRGQIKIPILSILDEMAHTLQSELPTVSNVGLLATSGTVASGIYQKCMEKIKINILLPDSYRQNVIMASIRSIKSNNRTKSIDKIREKLVDASEYLVSKGAQAIIIGCTEISLVLKEDHMDVPFLDSLKILAKAAVKYAGSEPI